MWALYHDGGYSMSRRKAYLGALKFHFGDAIVCNRKGRRDAWAYARFMAATYAFLATERTLNA